LANCVYSFSYISYEETLEEDKMTKCESCKEKTADNCQLCFLAEQKRRISIERKYIATLAVIDKIHVAVKNIQSGVIK